MIRKPGKPRKINSPEERIIEELVQKFRRRRMASTSAKPVAFTLEECSLAIIAALLSLHTDQEPGVLLADAHGLLNDAKGFLTEYAPQFDSDEERKFASYLKLTLKESMCALGFESYGGFWDAVNRAFDVEHALQLKTEKLFDLTALLAIQKCRETGKKVRARKARDAKRHGGT
jgi:hypothetical protein